MAFSECFDDFPIVFQGFCGSRRTLEVRMAIFGLLAQGML